MSAPRRRRRRAVRCAPELARFSVVRTALALPGSSLSLWTPPFCTTTPYRRRCLSYQPATSRLRLGPWFPPPPSRSGGGQGLALQLRSSSPGPSTLPPPDAGRDVTTPAAAITESRAPGLDRAEVGSGRWPGAAGRVRGFALAPRSRQQPHRYPGSRRRRVRVARVRAAAREERGAAAGSGGWHHGREGVHQGAGPVDRAAERVQAAVRVPGQEPLREGEFFSGCGRRRGPSPSGRRRRWGGCNMAEAAGPGTPRASQTGARRGSAAAPGRPGAPCLQRRDWLSPPPPPKMAPFTLLRGFRASPFWGWAKWLGAQRPCVFGSGSVLRCM